MYSRSIDPLEQCYVVKLSRFHRIAAPQPCFRFQHPNFPGARLEQPDAALAPQDTPKARGLEDMSSLPPEYEALEREAKQAWPEETTLEPEAEAEEEPPASVCLLPSVVFCLHFLHFFCVMMFFFFSFLSNRPSYRVHGG